MPAYDLIDFSYRRMDIFAYYFCTKIPPRTLFYGREALSFPGYKGLGID